MLRTSVVSTKAPIGMLAVVIHPPEVTPYEDEVNRDSFDFYLSVSDWLSFFMFCIEEGGRSSHFGAANLPRL